MLILFCQFLMCICINSCIQRNAYRSDHLKTKMKVFEMIVLFFDIGLASFCDNEGLVKLLRLDFPIKLLELHIGRTFTLTLAASTCVDVSSWIKSQHAEKGGRVSQGKGRVNV